jgi:hypothetical protein
MTTRDLSAVRAAGCSQVRFYSSAAFENEPSLLTQAQNAFSISDDCHLDVLSGPGLQQQ